MSNDFTNDNKNNDIVDIHIVILPDADVVCEAATGVAATTATCETTSARLVPREIPERAIRPSIYLHI